MDDEQNPNDGLDISEEEKQSESEALAEVKDEDLRKKVAEALGVDPEDEPELVEKAVAMKKADLEKMSKAIKQKISWREKAIKKADPNTSTKPKANPEEGKSHSDEKPLTAADIEKLFEEREAKRDLEALGLPEEIETEVKDLAKVKGISVREAAKLPYIASVIEAHEKAKRIESATPRRTSRGNYSTTDIDPSKPLNPNDFALDTEEGRKAWAEAKAARRKYESEQR